MNLQEVPDTDVHECRDEMVLSDFLLQSDDVKMEDQFVTNSSNPYQPTIMVDQQQHGNLSPIYNPYNSYLANLDVYPRYGSPDVYSSDGDCRSESPFSHRSFLDDAESPENYTDYLNQTHLRLGPQMMRGGATGDMHLHERINNDMYRINYHTIRQQQREQSFSPLEGEKRRIRREKNKQAASRCRNRKRERLEALEHETNVIEEENEKVQINISKLANQIEELKQILKEHRCIKNGGGSSTFISELANSIKCE